MIDIKELTLNDKMTLGTIITNVAEIQKAVVEKLKEYIPDNYKGKADAAKTDRAVLNTAGKQLDEARIELTKRWNEPLEAVVLGLKETCKYIKAASSELDKIVKSEEEREKSEKKVVIETFFKTLDFELVEFVRLFESHWLNKTCKESQWQSELTDKVTKIKSELTILEAIPEDTDTLKAFYLETLDIGNALERGKQLKAYREKIAETKPEIGQETEIVEVVETMQESGIDEEPIYKYVAEFICDIYEWQAIISFCKDNNIKFNRILSRDDA